MFFDIDPANGVPIYDQIIRQVKYAVARGAVGTGDRIPSVRELAKELLVNPNTIARSFQALQHEGVIVAQRGIGLEIAPGAKSLCVRQRRELIGERMLHIVREAHGSGLSEEEIQRLWTQGWATVKREGKKS